MRTLVVRAGRLDLCIAFAVIVVTSMLDALLGVVPFATAWAASVGLSRLISLLLFTTYRNHLSKPEQSYWACSLTSTIHAAVVVYLAAAALLRSPGFYSSWGGWRRRWAGHPLHYTCQPAVFPGFSRIPPLGRNICAVVSKRVGGHLGYLVLMGEIEHFDESGIVLASGHLDNGITIFKSPSVWCDRIDYNILCISLQPVWVSLTWPAAS